MITRNVFAKSILKPYETIQSPKPKLKQGVTTQFSLKKFSAKIEIRKI